MQIMEGDLATTLQKNLARIAHIQIADNPGRHEPGTGEINYDFLFDFIDRIGYPGWIGCEYKPDRGHGSRTGLDDAARGARTRLTMAAIGFIGLGIMGRPMALNLIKGGHTLFLHSRSGVPEDLTAAGGRRLRESAQRRRAASRRSSSRWCPTRRTSKRFSSEPMAWRRA